jgi:hypothetical protein
MPGRQYLYRPFPGSHGFWWWDSFSPNGFSASASRPTVTCSSTSGGDFLAADAGLAGVEEPDPRGRCHNGRWRVRRPNPQLAHTQFAAVWHILALAYLLMIWLACYDARASFRPGSGRRPDTQPAGRPDFSCLGPLVAFVLPAILDHSTEIREAAMPRRGQGLPKTSPCPFKPCVPSCPLSKISAA